MSHPVGPALRPKDGHPALLPLGGLHIAVPSRPGLLAVPRGAQPGARTVENTAREQHPRQGLVIGIFGEEVRKLK